MKYYHINNKRNQIEKIIFVFFIFFLSSFNSFCQNTPIIDPIYKKAISLKFKHQDSAIFYFKKGYDLRISEKDTLRAIHQLIGLANLYSHTFNYGESYDGYWKALLLAEKSNDTFSKSNAYLGLGLLYSFYKRNDEAIEYFNKSLSIRKVLNRKKLIHKNTLSENYFSISCHYRGRKDYVKSRAYLDSLRQIKDADVKLTKGYYYESEFGFLASINGYYATALKKLNLSKDFFEVNDPSYLVVIHNLIGKVYKKMGKNSKSTVHLKKSLLISNQYKSHLNYRLEAYDLLYELSLDNKNDKDAIKYLLKSKELSNKIFGINSSENTPLFGIKDKYRIEKDKQAQLINQQKIKELEHEDRIGLLQNILLGVIIISLLLFGYFFIQKIRTKHENEKILLKEKQKLELKRQKLTIDLKNKELTESALRIIEKDEFIANIYKKLKLQKDKVDVNVIKRILRSIQGNPTSNWDEFEARFTNINERFYKELKEKFPDLRQTDLKICALVKLNFSSKDMAKLIGISVDSVHTSRSRLRKKLGLDRTDNLEEFINNI